MSPSTVALLEAGVGVSLHNPKSARTQTKPSCIMSQRFVPFSGTAQRLGFGDDDTDSYDVGDAVPSAQPIDVDLFFADRESQQQDVHGRESPQQEVHGRESQQQ